MKLMRFASWVIRFNHPVCLNKLISQDINSRQLLNRVFHFLIKSETELTKEER